MKAFVATFLLQLSRVLRKPAVWVCLLAAPFLALALRGLSLSEGQSLQVGIYLEEENTYTQSVLSALLQYSDPRIEFIQANSPQQLETNVASTLWECGYLLHTGFEETLTQGKQAEVITCITSPATSMHLLTNEIISAATLQTAAPALARVQLVQNGINPAEEEWQQLSAQWFSTPLQIEPMYENTQNGVPQQQNPAAATLALPNLTHGLAGLLLFLFALLALAWHLQDKQRGFFQTTAPYLGVISTTLPHLMATLLPVLFSAFLVLLIGAGQYTSPFLYEAICLAAYTLYLLGWVVLLSAVLNSPQPVLLSLPFLLPACLLFSPIITNVATQAPIVTALANLLPTTPYMYAVQGKPAYALGMLLVGFFTTAMGFLLQWQKNPKNPN